MRLLAAALLTLLPAATGAVAVQQAPIRNPPVLKGAIQPGRADCPQTTSYYAYREGEPLKPRKLAELPPANAYAAVLRHDGRCEIPLVVKYGVGRR